MSSGLSTPLSQASTLIGSTELKDMLQADTSETFISSSVILEYYASKASSAIFLYDLARELGFGPTAKGLHQSSENNTYAVTFDVQSRAGAGLTLLGRLSEGTSSEAARALTAFTGPLGLAQMSPTLSLFPKPTSSSRVILQVPAASHIGSDLTLSPTLSSLNPFFGSVPESFAVLLSATPQEIADFTAISYTISQSHVVHIFDHWSAGRELSRKHTKSLTPSNPVFDTHTAFRKAGYDFFEYVGDAAATNVVIVLNSPLALSIKSVASVIPSFGAVIVKVLRPWDETALRKVVPTSVQSIHVLDHATSSTSFAPLFHDVLGGLSQSSSKSAPRVSSVRIDVPTLGQLLVSAQSLVGYLSSIIPINWFAPPQIPARNTKRIVFYSNPTTSLKDVPTISSQLYLTSPKLDAHLLQETDAFSKPGGTTRSTLIVGAAREAQSSIPIPFEVGQGPEVDALVILDASLLKSHDLFSSVKEGAPVLIVSPWNADEIISNLSSTNKENISLKRPHLLLLDTEGLSKELKDFSLEAPLVASSFLRLYLGQTATLETVTSLSKALFGKEINTLPVDQVARAAWDALKAVNIPVDGFPADEKFIPSKGFSFNTISPSPTNESTVTTIRSSPWLEAGKLLLFKEAFAPAPEPVTAGQYAQVSALRPDIAERRFLVTCTVNRRLTPLEYNRNVFHLEFDTSNTGLKYEIGEALGVHGWNDTQEVLDFCAWYGLNPGDVISIPVAGEPGKRHVRTIFQAFQQQIDIFGKPPKGFYEILSGHATAREDRMALRFISAAEGSSTFKKLSELETVTFADVLRKFPSARPPVEVLCEIVGDIKPRHYSIASAQSAVGDRVDLLVVTVDWVTPSGSPRYGQCTRYLAALKPGQKVTVSIKPSVMKLPPDNMQPIIMAGLGTGAAPFRAFMQHRALLASKKIPVGPMLYYFGSRHRSEEYLYGEEIEAFLQDGVITHAGLAFSRDEKRKVYIQHKMLQDGQMLSDMLGEKKGQRGVFYLCGPTWPVPDVFEAIVGALVEYDGLERSAAEQYIEDLKEEERYVLEVY
ncbi:related to MET10-sulfite reductase flavin-binding subunit [Serendipita indica DSM 11827]|uniref:assimilatory sulfite reductase (NADPH) n=1 Tax=Serendipita indica (strain DSM 11827) TaxID=1109443 RepID=G4U388_SERID|nr:related to MET10-sulfite reductase flavin-binding subunit [Serendipita indica DSM 11827]